MHNLWRNFSRPTELRSSDALGFEWVVILLLKRSLFQDTRYRYFQIPDSPNG